MCQDNFISKMKLIQGGRGSHIYWIPAKRRSNAEVLYAGEVIILYSKIPKTEARRF
jgi:hypothetical protein